MGVNFAANSPFAKAKLLDMPNESQPPVDQLKIFFENIATSTQTPATPVQQPELQAVSSPPDGLPETHS